MRQLQYSNVVETVSDWQQLWFSLTLVLASVDFSVHYRRCRCPEGDGRDGRTIAAGIPLDPGSPHDLKQSQSPLPFTSLLTGTDGCAAVCQNSGYAYCLKQSQGQLPHPAISAGCDKSTEPNIAKHSEITHGRKQGQGPLPFPAVLTCSDGSGVAYYVGTDDCL